MHQEEQHESAIDTEMHDPSQEVFFQDPELEESIENKDLEQGKDPGAENGKQNSLKGRKKPFRGWNLNRLNPDFVTEPGGHLIDESKSENGEGNV
jgi:hypothetical protein